MQTLLHLFKATFGNSPAKVEQLAKAGSNRQYVRFIRKEGDTVIGVIGQSLEENRCFIYLSRHFAAKGLPVPHIIAVSEDCRCYLQQDLGTRSLYDAVKGGRENGARYSEEELALVARAIRLLPHIQIEGADDLDFTQCLQPREFNHTAAMFDLNYFKYCFFRTTDMEHDEVRLQEDFERLAEDLSQGEHKTFLFRDFQARNIMLDAAGNPYVIDYQGGMLGPITYDVASFLWQASARYSAEIRERMVEEYLDELGTLSAVDKPAFRKRLRLFVFFRILQVLGAYGMRGYFERKKYFIDSIPPAIQSLRELLEQGVAVSYPYLEETLQRMVQLPQFNEPVKELGKASQSPFDNSGPLVVEITSFSFKNGIPQDGSGNGGGYVFDCRSTHNPGRYEEYKKLTGLDEPVIRFLENDGEILPFLDCAYKLAEHHVQRFIERGFSHVMFNFGCTGGQHRSVYCAQHLAEHLHQKFGVEVQLLHRKQNISQTFPARKLKK